MNIYIESIAELATDAGNSKRVQTAALSILDRAAFLCLIPFLEDWRAMRVERQHRTRNDQSRKLSRCTDVICLASSLYLQDQTV